MSGVTTYQVIAIVAVIAVGVMYYMYVSPTEHYEEPTPEPTPQKTPYRIKRLPRNQNKWR
jgi:hypothetical protein